MFNLHVMFSGLNKRKYRRRNLWFKKLCREVELELKIFSFSLIYPSDSDFISFSEHTHLKDFLLASQIPFSPKSLPSWPSGSETSRNMQSPLVQSHALKKDLGSNGVYIFSQRLFLKGIDRLLPNICDSLNVQASKAKDPENDPNTMQWN